MTNIKKILIGTAFSVVMFGAMTPSAFATVGGPTCDVPTDYSTIQAAVNDAGCTTINVAAGTYTEVGQIVINRDLTIIGADKTTTIIKPAQDTGNPASGDLRAWFLANSGVTFNLSNVTLDGSSWLVAIGILSRGNGTIENNVIKNIGYNPSTDYYGRGIQLFDTNMTVRNNTLQNIGRIGIFGFGPGVTSAIIEGNNYTGKGVGNWLDYGIELGGGAVATITNNTISGNLGVASVDGSTSAGILATTFFGPGTQATITSNTITGNTDGVAIGFNASDASVVVANRNNISGNTTTGVVSTGPTVNATCNWWGAANGPGPVGPGSGDNVSTNVTFTPWLTTADLDGACNGPFITVPTITTPVDGAIVAQSAMLEVDWSDSTGTFSPFEYQYEAFGDAGYLSSIYQSGWLTLSEIPTPGTSLGDYFVRVRARDTEGNMSAWSNGSSDVHKISVVADLTPTPTPINPFPVPAQCNQNIAYNLIEGTDGSNNINGTNGSDLILAKGGSDKVDGKGGADCIVGGGGSDKLIGGTGNDVILGGDGSDSLQGNDGADKLYGGNGSDSLKGGNQNDMLWGGNDSDSLHGDSGNDTLDGESGIDSAKGGTGTDTCTAESVRQCEI